MCLHTPGIVRTLKALYKKRERGAMHDAAAATVVAAVTIYAEK